VLEEVTSGRMKKWENSRKRYWNIQDNDSPNDRNVFRENKTSTQTILESIWTVLNLFNVGFWNTYPTVRYKKFQSVINHGYRPRFIHIMRYVTVLVATKWRVSHPKQNMEIHNPIIKANAYFNFIFGNLRWIIAKGKQLSKQIAYFSCNSSRSRDWASVSSILKYEWRWLKNIQLNCEMLSTEENRKSFEKWLPCVFY
jgi:hypothetical protein